MQDLEHVRQALKVARISQREIAERASVTESRVSRCLHSHTPVQVEIMTATCDLLTERSGETWTTDRFLGRAPQELKEEKAS